MHPHSQHTVRGGACAGQNLRCAAATLASHVACSQHASRTEKARRHCWQRKESRTSQFKSSESSQSVKNAAERQQPAKMRLLARAKRKAAMPQIMRKAKEDPTF